MLVWTANCWIIPKWSSPKAHVLALFIKDVRLHVCVVFGNGSENSLTLLELNHADIRLKRQWKQCRSQSSKCTSDLKLKRFLNLRKWAFQTIRVNWLQWRTEGILVFFSYNSLFQFHCALSSPKVEQVYLAEEHTLLGNIENVLIARFRY